ncbi:hypothetical protein RJ640_030351 [Escallonia rubra]|uniref:Uncharacterized protein n=1 Tax=Escallonia rubra TaxID=112253 RepID=A0AA88UCT4_9ASTE|nr:hypothetical protein RJ640_030351 [Escallonia rubra]
MIHRFRKPLQHTKPRVISLATRNSNDCFFSTSSSSKTLNSTDPQSLAVSYLVKSCGLSLDSAISVSRKIQSRFTTDRFDSVWQLLNSHGLTQTQIRDVIIKRPLIVLADPTKTLKSNIELFSSLALSGNTLAKVLQRKPVVLESPHANSAVEFFRTHGFSDEQIKNMILKRPRIFTFHPERTLKPKLDFLQSVGFSLSDIVKLISIEPCILERSVQGHLIPAIQALKKIVQSDENVVKAVIHNRNFFLLTHDLGKDVLPKVSTLISLGIPKSNIFKLFMLGVMSLRQTTEKFNKVVRDVAELGFDPKKVVFVLAVRSFLGLKESVLEQKIQVFSSFGLSRSEFFLAFKMQPILPEKTFVKNFVTKYQQMVPEVVKAHRGEIDFQGFDINNKALALGYLMNKEGSLSLLIVSFLFVCWLSDEKRRQYFEQDSGRIYGRNLNAWENICMPLNPKHDHQKNTSLWGHRRVKEQFGISGLRRPLTLVQNLGRSEGHR